MEMFDLGEFMKRLVKYLVEGSEYKEGYLSRGDVIMMCMQSPSAKVSDDDVTLTIVPKVGVPMFLETVVPEIIGQTRIYMYP